MQRRNRDGKRETRRHVANLLRRFVKLCVQSEGWHREIERKREKERKEKEREREKDKDREIEKQKKSGRRKEMGKKEEKSVYAYIYVDRMISRK